MTYRYAILIGLVLGIIIGWAALALGRAPQNRRAPQIVVGVRNA